ncbi:MAG TPA: TusE/DsrC/DsvC family sulfur relay protein [Gammaproteobacteria bacterium]|nr:TusE/DsrC/DsvC family sulfur relay protein [Gammaproteobacteria bacterium]
MALEVNGRTVETTDEGYLVEVNDWDEDVAQAIADADGFELTEKHWDVIRYLRDQHVNNGGEEPNERTIQKAMGKLWGSKPSSKEMYELFPNMPSKQGRKFAGLPKSTRKGGY